MTIKALDWALYRAPVQDAFEFSVLVCLADHAHSDGTSAYPSVKTVADTTHMSERKVQTVLHSLEARRVIRKGDQSHAAKCGPPGRRPNVWDLDLTLTRPPVSQPAFTDASGEERGAPDDVEGCTDDARGVHGVHPNQLPNQLQNQEPPSGAQRAPHQAVTDRSQPYEDDRGVWDRPRVPSTEPEPPVRVLTIDEAEDARLARTLAIADRDFDRAARFFDQQYPNMRPATVVGMMLSAAEREAGLTYAEQAAIIRFDKERGRASLFDRTYEAFRDKHKPAEDRRRQIENDWKTQATARVEALKAGASS
jgi:hypothetical protein